MRPIENDHLLIANNIQNMEIGKWIFFRNDKSMFEIVEIRRIEQRQKSLPQITQIYTD